MKRVYLFLAYGFEEVEALTTVDLLRRAGIQVITVSVTGNDIVTGAHKIPVVADIKIDNGAFDDGDAFVIPGGQPGVDNLYECKEFLSIITNAYKSNKLVCAICAAPMLLGRLGLLEDKKATCYPGCEAELTGADISEDRVCVDGNIVTSRGVGTAVDFASKITELLLNLDKAAEIRASILA